jgi:hypothetical protein
MKGSCAGQLGRTFGECLRKPTVVRNGKPYCWQHDPEKISAARAAAWEARKVEIARIEAESDARIARRKLERAAGVENVTDAELQAIVALGGIRVMIEKLSEEPNGQTGTRCV